VLIHSFQNRRMVVSGVVVAPVRISGNLRGSRGLHRPADGLGLPRSPSLSQPFPVGQSMVRGGNEVRGPFTRCGLWLQPSGPLGA
jgi:hypothetical protein